MYPLSTYERVPIIICIKGFKPLAFIITIIVSLLALSILPLQMTTL